jgi:hypothetical protein
VGGRIHIEGKRFFDAMKRQHGAVGLAWQQHLVVIGLARIKTALNQHREHFLALPEVAAVVEKAHPQVRAVVNRFALYATGLRVAIEAGLLPWNIVQADVGIVACMDRWVAQRGNVDTAGEIVRAVRQVEADLVAAIEGGHFVRLHKTNNGWNSTTEVGETVDG